MLVFKFYLKGYQLQYILNYGNGGVNENKWDNLLSIQDTESMDEIGCER